MILKTKILLVILFLGILSISYGISLLLVNLHISNIGNIKTINLESDTTQIDWGTLGLNYNVSRLIHVRAVNSVAVTLNFTTTAPSYLLLSWNYTGAQVKQAWTPINFTLYSTMQALNGSFSFLITITGAEVT